MYRFCSLWTPKLILCNRDFVTFAGVAALNGVRSVENFTKAFKMPLLEPVPTIRRFGIRADRPVIHPKTTAKVCRPDRWLFFSGSFFYFAFFSFFLAEWERDERRLTQPEIPASYDARSGWQNLQSVIYKQNLL